MIATYILFIATTIVLFGFGWTHEGSLELFGFSLFVVGVPIYLSCIILPIWYLIFRRDASLKQSARRELLKAAIFLPIFIIYTALGLAEMGSFRRYAISPKKTWSIAIEGHGDSGGSPYSISIQKRWLLFFSLFGNKIFDGSCPDSQDVEFIWADETNLKLGCNGGAEIKGTVYNVSGLQVELSQSDKSKP